MLNGSGDNRYRYFVPGYNRDVSNVSQESKMCATGFWYLPFIKLRKLPLHSL